MKRKQFTNTAIPAFSGAECWFQQFHISQAIIKSNGWSDETAALQIFAHLEGEALDVALLLPKDPATFATELGILALQGFEDMSERARNIMIRDRFIAGHSQCALRRQLDGFAPDTPIGEIVDSCRVWESHSDSRKISEGSHSYQQTAQPSDFRTRERVKPETNRQLNVSVINEQKPEIGIVEDFSEIKSLLTRLLQPTQNSEPGEQSKQLMAAGPVCFSCGQQGYGINRCPRINATFPFLPLGWSVNMDNGQYRATRTGKITPPVSSGNGEWSGREGQPPGPVMIKARLTPVGGSTAGTSENLNGRCRRNVTKVPTAWLIPRNYPHWERRRIKSDIQQNRTVRSIRVPPP